MAARRQSRTRNGRQDDDEEQIQRADVGVTNKRARLIGSAAQRQLRIQSPIQQSATGSNSFAREVESDSTSRSEGEEDVAYGGNAILAAAIAASTTVMLTDTSALHCPLCNKPLRAPIFQCENGHISCLSCSATAISVCLSCTTQVGFIRNWALEKLANSILRCCKNTTFGCKEIMIYHELIAHEEVCPQTACLCPYPSCSFTQSADKLYDHFGTCHPSSVTPFTYDTTFDLIIENNQKHVFLQERNEGVIFILNHELQEDNRTFNVDCIGAAKFNKVFVYQLTAKYKEACLSLQAVPEVCVKWEQHAPNKNYLTIPATFSDENVDLFAIRICIKKSHPIE
ncbi:hypothetical protein OSB04_027414 [Centaurea solstitialis]|uniref:RING-type E3 ubiquitin transferase n=1 Tax=Centaurea solstitialis TaxID=347529 RepID=A0AA38SYS8_9ASTR|nr:hypothetical protein OSB04_027414 [Centaurea solstitialis]